MSNQNIQPSDSELPARLLPGLLATKYRRDYEEAVKGFSPRLQIELVEHLMSSLDFFENWVIEPSQENWKLIADKETAFLKKHEGRLKAYQKVGMQSYYQQDIVLAEKGIYTPEAWSKLQPEKQELTRDQQLTFIQLCRNFLFMERDFILVQQTPEDEKESLGQAKDNQATDFARKGRIKREAKDNKTCLNHEQTVLLLYLLQQNRFFLKDEYLTDLDAGRAFEILTGYSATTTRQNLGKIDQSKTRPNLVAIDDFLTRVKINIDKVLKEIKKPEAPDR
jgi:hypothetical protein